MKKKTDRIQSLLWNDMPNH